MIRSQAVARQDAPLTNQEIVKTLVNGLSGTFTGQKVLVLIPDHTRSLPLPFLFRTLVEILHDTRQLNFMIALGTHPPLPDDRLNALVGISQEEREGKYRHINIFNHDWAKPGCLASLGVMEQDEIKSLAETAWHPSLPEQVEIRINKAVLEHDHILILGPTFPHEVAGFSGGAKYLFPGIAGPEMINATHWLGALSGVVKTIGCPDTPVRNMIHAAARRVPTPITLAAMVVDGHDLAGMYIGDLYEAWNASVELSAKINIHWYPQPFRQVLSCAPTMYDELWTAAKAMYKLEPVVAMGGEVIIYAPHLETISHVHGKFIHKIGYHILPYFLAQWDRYQKIPLGVLAHSTHLRGSGVMQGDREVPNVHVTLASRIPAEECDHLNLGYLDPKSIQLKEWQNREEEGILLVPQAGEKLFKVQSTAQSLFST